MQRLKAQTVIVGSGAGGDRRARADDGGGGADHRGRRLPQAGRQLADHAQAATAWAISRQSRALRWSGCSPWAGAPSSSAAWPFHRRPGSRSGTASTAPYVDEVSKEVRPRPTAGPPGGAVIALMAAAREEGLDWNPFPHFIDPAECDLLSSCTYRLRERGQGGRHATTWRKRWRRAPASRPRLTSSTCCPRAVR